MQNPISTVKKYLKNVDKELGQALRAGEKSLKAKGNANLVKLPSGKTMKVGLTQKELDANTRKQRSEFFGALLQARRYDGGVKTTTKTVNKLYRPSSNN
jgi:hypothetical protein